MSLITPIPQSTIIRAYGNVDWDNTYSDVRLFDNAQQRESYLTPLVKGVWQNCSIVDIGKSIKVEANINNCLDISYLSFQNLGMGSTQRTFYAFVTAVDYVNVNTVMFTYEIDWIQTYLFDYVFESCLVEREHVNDDTVGKNTVPENLDTGEYCVLRQVIPRFRPAAVLVILPKTDFAGAEKDNMYIAGTTYISNLDDLSYFNEILATVNDTPERVASFYMGVTDMQVSTTSTFFHKTVSVAIDSVFQFGTEQYVPKNNKLRVYPYMLMTADNYIGDVEQYHIEDFNVYGTAEFAIEGSAIPKPSMMCFPINYKNVHADSTQPNTYSQQGVLYENFPAVPYATDAFKAWISQYGTSKAVSAGASVAVGAVAMGAGLMTGNPAVVGFGLNEIGGGVSQGADLVQQAYEHSIHSVQMHGGVGSAGLNYAQDYIGFRFTTYGIKPEFAKRIDDFFTRYGYRVDTPKVPNVRGRQYVNYVKCKGAKVSGAMPVDARDTMERALNAGVSFWHVNNMGQHLTSNPIV